MVKVGMCVIFCFGLSEHYPGQFESTRYLTLDQYCNYIDKRHGVYLYECTSRF